MPPSHLRLLPPCRSLFYLLWRFSLSPVEARPILNDSVPLPCAAPCTGIDADPRSTAFPRRNEIPPLPLTWYSKAALAF